jgi:hypothetical protein
MRGMGRIDPGLLTVYASLIFFIGSFVTLMSSIISYRTGRGETPGALAAGELTGFR